MRKRTLTQGGALAALVLIICCLSFWLRTSVPLWIIADAGHDDQLFARSANEIASGEWLGSFDNRTLLKGPGYPTFLAVVDALSVPYDVAVHLLHLVAAASVGVAAHVASHRRWVATFVFGIVALDPSRLGAGSARVLRDDWYASICLLLFMITFSVLATSGLQPRGKRLPLLAAGAGLGLGLIAVAYWIGREERIWLLPSLLFLVLGALWLARLTPRRLLNRYGSRWSLAALVVAALVASIGVSVVQRENERRYGVSLITDYADGAFPEFYAAWQRVKVPGEEPRQYVPISAAKRQLIYSNSPAAAQLAPHLDGPLRSWIDPGCSVLRVCDDFASGWITYALRDAVSFAGHYDTGADAQNYFGRVTDEINTACETGAFRCDPPAPQFLPPLSEISTNQLLRGVRDSALFLMSFDLADTRRPLSSGAPANWELFDSVLPRLDASVQEHVATEPGELREAVRLAGPVAAAYSAMCWLFLPLAAAGYALALWARASGWLALLGVASLSVVAVRLLLLAAVEVTSFPAVRTTYALPASGFLLVGLACGVALLFEVVRGRRWPGRLPYIRRRKQAQ